MVRIAVFATLLIGYCASAISAGSDGIYARKVPETFTKKLVEAINDRDLDEVREIVHPATLACMTEDKDDYYAWWLWKDGGVRYTVTPDYTVVTDRPLDVAKTEANMKRLGIVMQHWPVQPDLGMFINYKPAPKSIMQRLFQITLKGNEAKLVIDCPTEEGLKQFDKVRAAAARQKKKLAHLVRTMGPEDRQALETMARGGMKLDGIKAVEQKYHLSTDEALALMDMMQYDDTPER